MHSRALCAVLGAVAMLATFAVPAAAAPPPIEKDAAACLADGGVWVIVDTGEKVIAADCAKNPESGGDALAKIGVNAQKGASGTICALNDEPKDMCAKDGYDAETKSFWSYWTRSGAAGDWEFAQTSADESKPAPGSVEGWRWGDGSPQQVPKVANERVAANPDPAKPDSSDAEEGPWALIGVGALLALLLAGFVFVRLRARSKAAGGEDPDTRHLPPAA